MTQEQKQGHFVQVKGSTGLRAKHVKQAVQLLGRREKNLPRSWNPDQKKEAIFT
jgi:hypothetical protein